MKIVFYAADKDSEGLIASAFNNGVMLHGDTAVVMSTTNYDLPEMDADVAVVIGVKGKSRKIIDDYGSLGKQFIYVDKGYLRIANTFHDRLSRSLYYKISVNDFQPLKYLMDLDVPTDRWDNLQSKHGIELKPFKYDGEEIIWLGPSQKYCDFHHLGDATLFSERMMKRLSKLSKHTIVYRPKHSWKDAQPIQGTRFSRPPRKIEDEFVDAYALVVHGSNMSAEAIINGIPVVTLGPAIARPVSLTDIEKIENRSTPTDARRLDWLSKIAYCQWTVAEMADGSAWEHVRSLL